MKRTMYLPLLLLLALSACQAPVRRVAIMDFENNTGEKRYDFLASAVPEYLTADMTNREGVLLLERQDIRRFLAEIDADLTDMRRLSRWQTLGRRVRAEYLVAGSVSRLQSNFILTARLFDVERGEIVPGSAIVGTCVYEAQIFDRAHHMATLIADRLSGGAVAAPARTVAEAAAAPAEPAPVEVPAIPEVPEIPGASPPGK